MTVELNAKTLGTLVILGIPGVLDLLCKKAMSVAMGLGMLAERAGNMVLIDTEEQIIEGDGVDL